MYDSRYDLTQYYDLNDYKILRWEIQVINDCPEILAKSPLGQQCIVHKFDRNYKCSGCGKLKLACLCS